MDHEERIKEKTSSLFQSYLELTGFSGNLSISDFLVLRKEAMEEVRKEDILCKNRKKDREEEKKENRERAISSANTGHSDRPVPKTPVSVISSIETSTQSSASLPDPDSEENKEEDDYEILRRMEDPWN